MNGRARQGAAPDVDEPVGDVWCGAVGEFDELPVTGGAFDDGADLGLAGLTDDQVAFPMARNRTIVGLEGVARC